MTAVSSVPSSSSRPADARRALLLAVGPQAAQAVAADLRWVGKEVIALGDWRDVADRLAAARGATSVLVVLPGEEMTYAAVEAVLDAAVAAGIPVGLLPVQRDGRVLGADRAPAPPAAALGAMYCHFRTGFDCDSEFGRTQAEDFLARLRGGVEAAVFHVHGNGADLQLGNHVMCVQVDHLRGTPRPGDLTLDCQVGGPCRLAHLPAITAYWGASAMRSRIAVLVSCWGYHPADGVLHAEVLFGTALFRGPSVEAFIASTRVTFNTPELAQAALAFLEMGGTAGELTLLLNRFPGTVTPPYVCIGDPDVRVRVADGVPTRHVCGAGTGAAETGTADPDQVTWPELSAVEVSSRAPEVPAAARAEILAAFGPVLKEGRPGAVTSATRSAVAAAAAARQTPPGAGGQSEPESPPQPEPVQLYRGLSALVARHTGDLPVAEADAFWALVHSGASTARLDEQWCQVQTRLLRRRGPEQLGYLSAGSVYRDERLDRVIGPDRHLCGKRMFRITVEFTALGGYLRELCFCERCGPVADVPAGSPAPFAVADGEGVRVVGSPWPTAWVTTGVVPVGFSLLTPTEPRRVSLDEPLPLPDVPPGRRLGVVLVADGDHVLLETEMPPLSAEPLPAPDQDRPDREHPDRDRPTRSQTVAERTNA